MGYRERTTRMANCLRWVEPPKRANLILRRAVSLAEANYSWATIRVNNFPPLASEAARRPSYSTSIAPPMPRLVPLVARSAGSNRNLR